MSTATAERFVGWIARHRTRILLTSLFLAMASSASLLRLEVDVGLVSMLPHGTKVFADYQRFVGRFGAQDIVVALIRAPDRGTATRFADAFDRELGSRPEILAVRSRVDREAFLGALRDGALPRLLPLDAYPELERRLDPASIDQAVRSIKLALAAPGGVGLAAPLAADPLGLSHVLGEALARSRPDRALDPASEYLTSSDGTRLILLVRPRDAGFDLPAVERLAAALAEAERAARSSLAGTASNVSVGYTGAFAFAREDAAVLRRDLTLYTVLALVGVLAVFHAGYRNLRVLPFVTYHLVVTSLLTLAMGLVLEGHLDLISLAFAAIFYGLGIDTAIHVYTRFLEERKQGAEAQAALACTLERLLWPTLLACATTALAFAAIGFSDLRGVAQLGFLTMLGMALNVPATLVLLPALLLSFDARGGFARAPSPSRATWLAAAARWTERRRLATLLAVLCILAVAGVGVGGATFDANLFHLRPEKSQAASVQEEIAQEFGFTDPDGSVLIEATEGDPASLEAVLELTEDVTRRLEQLRASGEVRSVTSPASLLPSRSTQEGRLARWRELPRERAAQDLQRALERSGFRTEAFVDALLLLDREPEPVDPTLGDLPGIEMILERHLKRDSSGLSILVAFTPLDRASLAHVAERLAAEVEVPPGVRFAVTGRPLMERELYRVGKREIAWFLAAVAVGTAALVFLRERRMGPTLAILAIPSGSLLLTLGIAGAAGVAITPVNLVALPLIIGIGVDYCLYFVERMHETGDAAEAMLLGGRALTIDVATTVVGFGVLALSRYPALRDLGLLAALGLTICFLGTVLVLPALLRPGRLRQILPTSA